MSSKYVLPSSFSWVDTSSPAFQEALDAIMDPGIGIVAIAGPGGSGKSVLYRIAYDLLKGRKLCTASTGIAAFNIAKEGIPAVTLHAGLHVEPKDWYDPCRIDGKLVKRLQKIDTLLIDEVSMISVNLMDYLMVHIDRANRMRKGRSPIRLIVFGDVMQLMPVTKAMQDEVASPRWMELYGSSSMFFNSPRYKARERRTIELYDVYRQDDAGFRDILNSIRMGNVTDEMLDKLNEHVMPLDEFSSTVGKGGMMLLAGRNETVNRLNAEYQKSFEENGVLYAEHAAEYDGTVSSTDFPGIQEVTRIYLGQQVMCTANDRSDDKAYQNGTIGKVVGFESALPVVRTADGRRFTVQRQDFVKNRILENPESGLLEAVEAGYATQLACKSAYAVTYHKAQGLTLDAVYLDLSGWLAPHSLYLGLSRLRSIDGLGLSRPIRRSDIRIDPEALGFFSNGRDDTVPYDPSLYDESSIRKEREPDLLDALLGQGILVPVQEPAATRKAEPAAARKGSMAASVDNPRISPAGNIRRVRW